MSPQESLEHEAIKIMLKFMVSNNNQLTPEQKQLALNNIDIAANQADWLTEILKACGYLK